MDLAHASERGNGWASSTTVALMSAAFLIALALAVIILVIFGAGERGTAIALQATARWSFFLFWPAYVGGAIAWLWPRLSGLARHGRELGLAYASAQLIHVGLVFWIIHVATGPSGPMVFFWIGIFCTYLLALFSLPRLRAALDLRLWRIFLAIALEYIAVAFAADFILAPLQASGLEKYPVTYLPFALLLVSGAGLRFVAFCDRRLRPLREDLFLKVAGSSPLFHFDRMSRHDHLVVWPALLFVAAIVVLLALDHALWGALESILALYGPPIAVLGVYVLLKSAARGVSLIVRQV
jgi:hypothetical protein